MDFCFADRVHSLVFLEGLAYASLEGNVLKMMPWKWKWKKDMTSE
jgi:hypothetical protein